MNKTTNYPPEGTSLEAEEISNREYCIRLKHPSDWADITFTGVYAAIAPSKIVGLFALAWNAAWGDSLAEAVAIAFTEAPVQIPAVADTTLADGTAADVVEYKATIVGLPTHCYSVGVMKDGRWIAVSIRSLDQYTTCDRALFEEIAHTLEFN
jgi:hypothetical protein